MSYASEHPVYCARREDLNCQASHPGSRWDSIKADGEGWFHSKAEECAYCPAHVPAWRAARAARLHKVKKTFTREPAVLKCDAGDLERTEAGEDPDTLAALRDVAREHARETGHRVTVTTTQTMTVEPVDD